MSSDGTIQSTIENGVSPLPPDRSSDVHDTVGAITTWKSKKRKSIEDDGNSTDALADAFSTSLAQIASASRRTPVVSSGRGLLGAISAVSASSLDSSTTTPSTTTQTSSGEDRDSSGSGCDAVVDRKVHGSSHTTTACAAAQPSTEPFAEPSRVRAYTDDMEPSVALLARRIARKEDRPHYHRHLKKHSLPTKVHELIAKPWLNDGDSTSINASGSSVPMVSSASASVPIVHQHKTVVAHRLPLDSGSGTNFESSGGAYSSGGDTRGVAGDVGSPSLLQPFREPCFQTIRQTFKKFVKRASRNQMPTQEASTTGEDDVPKVRKRAKRCTKRQPCVGASEALLLTMNKSLDGAGHHIEEESGLSSGSGTEGGYGASNSSNGNVAQSESSSPSSEESSEESGNERKQRLAHSTGDPLRPMLSKKRESTHNSMSSEIADFSSSYSLNARKANRSESPSLSSSSCLGEQSENQVVCVALDAKAQRLNHLGAHRGTVPWQVPPAGEPEARRSKKRGRAESGLVRGLKYDKVAPTDGNPTLLSIGCDVMAHVLTFLEPPDILDVLTMPLSKDWSNSFTSQPELWRVLCLLEPFKAQIDDGERSDSESSDDESIVSTAWTTKKSKFRLLYTSYVRCMRCLIRIKDDAINGRPLSAHEYYDGLERTFGSYNLGGNQNLQQFLSRARGAANAPGPVMNCNALSVVVKAPKRRTSDGVINPSKSDSLLKRSKPSRSGIARQKKSPPSDSNIGAVELPWSCGIYSIVHWMMAYTDVEGIQTMCLRVLPFLLENEEQRITAQRAGLTDIVLRGMVLFPESAMLHTAAFHTIVLLARPLGGQEGMLFHTSMVNSSGIFSSSSEGSASGKSGIAVLLDSMRRFQSDEVLQSMACWSLVNIALAPVQKGALIKLGGIEAILNAMMEHQYCAEVQFRALFALINLVIPSANTSSPSDVLLPNMDSSEKEMIDEMVDQIIALAVAAMRNFCSNEAILNRACLVLHNLSLTHDYHMSMLWTPNCYQMLEWCLRNYRTDQVLQQSAAGTLHRLQMALNGDASLRARFTASVQALQKKSVEDAHCESLHLGGEQQTEGDEETPSVMCT